MIEQLYAPTIEAKIPAFTGAKITVAFEHSQLVNQNDYTHLALTIKDPLQNDKIIETVFLPKTDDSIKRQQAIFNISQSLLVAGNYYKLYLAYAVNTDKMVQDSLLVLTDENYAETDSLYQYYQDLLLSFLQDTFGTSIEIAWLKDANNLSLLDAFYKDKTQNNLTNLRISLLKWHLKSLLTQEFYDENNIESDIKKIEAELKSDSCVLNSYLSQDSYTKITEYLSSLDEQQIKKQQLVMITRGFKAAGLQFEATDSGTITGIKNIIMHNSYVWSAELLGHNSSVGITRYLETLPITRATLTNGFLANFNYKAPKNVPSEKVLSVVFELYDETSSLLQQSDEIIVNYSAMTQQDDFSYNITYQFEPEFNPVTEKDYSIQDLLALGVDPVYIDSSVDYDYYAMLNNAVLLKKVDIGRRYTVKACYKTLNLYQNQQYANHTIRWLSLINDDYSLIVSNNETMGLNMIEIKQNKFDVNLTNISLLRYNIFTDQYESLLQVNNFEELEKKMVSSLVSSYTLSNGKKSIIDFAIEQGYQYQYIYQGEYDGYVYYLPSTILEVDYEDMFLCDKHAILRLRFNPKVTNYKKVISQAKQEVIGQQFPIISRNGAVNYTEFSISAFLSYLSDTEGYYFSSLKNGPHHGLYKILYNAWGEEYARISRRNSVTASIEYDANGIAYVNRSNNYQNITLPQNDMSSQNFMLEREFKMSVIEWLNNGEIKMFKSPAEGLHLVVLNNVTTSPEDRLSRMLYTITASAIEVAAPTAKNIATYGMNYYAQKN